MVSSKGTMHPSTSMVLIQKISHVELSAFFYPPKNPAQREFAGSLECNTVPGWCYFVGELHSPNARTGAYATEKIRYIFLTIFSIY